MHPIDAAIFIAYMALMLGVGFYFLKKNQGADDYYVGGRDMGALHVGMSVVATDVGGGFSIGLGGLGFTMGLSGSWMLFTGLLGAWLSAVLLIPKVKRNRAFDGAFTFPEVVKHYYGARVALIAGIISAVGYIGFSASQILAGAKLAHGFFVDLGLTEALLIMGGVAIVYTVLGGMKAVIYTDTLQWIILMAGLIFVGIPICYSAVGGYDAIASTVEPEMLSLTNISWQTLVNWMVTIVPIWFVAMTLYQRIYACRDEATAKRAWYVAGLLEWPIMAFMGILLGLMAHVAAEQGMFDQLAGETGIPTDAEAGLPMLLRVALPVGLTGVMLSAYFSAILSTADSCLMASSGNLVSDIIGHFRELDPESKGFLRLSQGATLFLGIAALLLASVMTNVLGLMLYSYAFMVSGLLVPIIGALFWKRGTPVGAGAAMILGGTTTVALELSKVALPLGLDANVYGIGVAAVVFVGASLAFKQT